MKTVPIVYSDESVTVMLDGRPFIISKSSENYKDVARAIINDSEEELRDAIFSGGETDSDSEPIDYTSEDGSFVLKNGEAFCNGERLPQSIVDRAYDLRNEGLDLEFLVNFSMRLMDNPSYQSRQELYDFLANRYIPITPDGYFLANKGIDGDYYSHTGGAEVPIIGKTDERGRIYNGIGEEIKLKRGDVDDDRDNQCSHGLHVGSWEYASGFASKTVIVKVDPASVVSVPRDFNAKKCRVCHYWVLGDAEAPLDKSTYRVTEESETGVDQMAEEDDWFSDEYLEQKLNETLSKIVSGNIEKSNNHSDENAIAEDIYNYLERRGGYATLRQINNAMTAGKNPRWSWTPYKDLRDIIGRNLPVTFDTSGNDGKTIVSLD